MMKKTRYGIVSAQYSSVFSTLLLTGLGLLILTLILLLKIYEVSPVNPQNGNLIFIFMIIFAVFGFSLIIFGLFGIIKLTKSMQKIIPKLMEETTEIRKSTQGRASGLQIIRPGIQQKVDENTREQPDTSSKPIKETKAERKEEPVKAITKEIKEVPSDFSYNDGLQNIVDRYNTEKVRKAFKNWYNTLMITFPDISKSFLFKIKGDESLDFSEGIDAGAAVQVIMDSTVFVKMMTKQINPIKAYSSGGLEVKGEMKNMLKLRKLMF